MACQCGCKETTTLHRVAPQDYSAMSNEALAYLQGWDREAWLELRHREGLERNLSRAQPAVAR